MHTGLKNRIENYLLAWKQRNPDYWENGGELERLALENGYKASNSSRRCRELVEEGILEARYNEKGHVLYRYVW